jgi:hypothetical protein
VIGKSRVIRLANGGATNLCGAARAFLAELVEAQWHSPQEAASAYPAAEVEGHRIVIPLDSRHCVVVVVSHTLEVALIEYAGLRKERMNDLSAIGRKVGP